MERIVGSQDRGNIVVVENSPSQSLEMEYILLEHDLVPAAIDAFERHPFLPNGLPLDDAKQALPGQDFDLELRHSAR